MTDLRVTLGQAVRDEFRTSFDSARRSIDAEFFSIDDHSLVDALNRAACRGVAVTVHVEGDPGRYRHSGKPNPDHVAQTRRKYERLFDARVHFVVDADREALEHAKAAVVDGNRCFIATANANKDGFECEGQVCIEDDEAADVGLVADAIRGHAGCGARVIAGPGAATRERIMELLRSSHGLKIAIEDLSDAQVVATLIGRHAAGLCDEVLVKRESRPSRTAAFTLEELHAAGVGVRSLGTDFMHDKFIDAGDAIYVGSANLTHNGLDEAREIGIVAPATDFGDGAAAMRTDFDRMWSKAQPA